MGKSIFEVITEYGMDEGVNEMLMKNEEYGRIKEKEERLAGEVDGFGLTEEQRLAVDRLVSSCNESGALYGKMTYQQGFRDCAALLLLSSAGGSVSGNTASVTPHAEGTVGNAFANGTGGYKGLPHDEKNALRSEYGQPELTVYPDGKTELTTEPVMSDLPKGTVIFNEEQTRQIMKNKGEVVEAYKSGTVRMSDGTVITPEGKVHYPLTPSDPTYQMMKKFEEYFAVNKDAFIKPANAMNNAAEAMKTVIETINNNNTMNRNINVDVGGVHVHGVQNPEEFSDVVNLRIHNKILQEMHKY